MLPILLLSSSVYSLTPNFFCSIFSSSSLIIFNTSLSFLCFPFHCLQFLSSLLQYSWSYYLSDYPNNFFAINLPSSSPLLNVPFSCSCLLTFFMSYWYSFSNSLIASLVFSRFSLPSQVFDSTVNHFYLTKYLFFSLIYCLFKILSTSYSSFLLIITGASCSFLCSSTCPMYLHILLTLTTRCIFTVLDSSNLTVFDNTIFFTL